MTWTKTAFWALALLALLELGAMGVIHYRHQVQVQELMQELATLREARDRAATLEYEREATAAQDAAKAWVEREANSWDLDSYLRLRLGALGEGARQ